MCRVGSGATPSRFRKPRRAGLANSCRLRDSNTRIIHYELPMRHAPGHACHVPTAIPILERRTVIGDVKQMIGIEI